MQALVLHANNPTFSTVVQPLNKNAFSLVAILDDIPDTTKDSAALEHVFMLTNNLDEAWIHNEEVDVYSAGGQRSTSVGDVVILRKANKERLIYQCMHCGWEITTFANV